jgi:glycosyltransferase involved in cell wall biosynthesis
MRQIVKIAQVAPLIESVPPKRYGGTERVVSYLTEELVKQGHEVTLFATEDSITSAQLIASCPRALRSMGCTHSLAWDIIQMEHVIRSAADFDIVHFHNDYLHFPITRRMRTPHVTTLHGRLDLPELPFIYETFPDVPLVSISDAQRTPLPEAQWQATIYHGLPEDWQQTEDLPAEYLLFLGRISPEKGADRAIQIAIEAESPLVMAAKIDPVDQAYFEGEIAPMLNHPLITFIGEVGDTEKRELFKKAEALLFPINWPEPFGLVMIEAMACGVPIIAFRNGSVPEIVEHGKTGFVVANLQQAIEAIRTVRLLKRSDCRQAFLDRFTASRMASEYVREYKRLIHTADGPAEENELMKA